jgi:GNAT superfamily N-acetyltransferase
MTIRPAKQSDKTTFLTLLIELKKSGYQEMGVPFAGIEITARAEKLFDDCLENESIHLLVAEESEAIIGICVAIEIPKIIEGRARMLIEELVIDQKHRSRGIGSLLLKHLEELAKQKGIKHMKVTTGTKLKANDFYKKHNYVYFENAYRKELT